MKRLMVFTENYVGGGSDRHLMDIANALKDDFEDIVVVSNPPGLAPDVLRRAREAYTTLSIQVVTLTRLFHQYFRNFRRLARLTIRCLLIPFQPLILVYDFLLCIFWLNRLKPVAVLGCNGGHPGSRMTLLMIIASKLSGAKTILSIVSMPLARRRIVRPYEWLLDKAVWAASDIVLVNAYAISRSLQNMRNMPADKVVVIHNGLEDAHVPEIETDGLKDEFKIGFLGRVSYEKGIIFLLDAFRKLEKEHPKARMVIAGKGDALGQINKTIGEYGLNEKINLVGYYDGDVSTLLSSFDVYVFPSLHEGLPYSILEAMRGGLAIVSTDVGGIPELIRDGLEGILVPPGSADGLAAAIEKLIKDPELRKALGENARDRFVKMYTLESMQREVKELFARRAA